MNKHETNISLDSTRKLMIFNNNNITLNVEFCDFYYRVYIHFGLLLYLIKIKNQYLVCISQKILKHFN